MSTLFSSILLSLLVVTALAVGRQKNLFAATMLMGIFSLLSASLFVLMDAVDVALTEAAIGAGIATILFLSSLAAVKYRGGNATTHRLPALLVVVITGLLLMYGLRDIPGFGAPDAPVHTYLSPRFLLQSPDEVGVPNIVTAILSSYRGYDTLGEVSVIFTSLLGVLLLLGRSKEQARRTTTKEIS